MSNTILFCGGPHDGLLLLREWVDKLPSSEVNADYKLILLPDKVAGQWWLSGYLLGWYIGNVATYSHANNSPHVLATTTPDQHVKPKTFIPPPPSDYQQAGPSIPFELATPQQHQDKAAVNALLSDPRTYRKGDDAP